jgi:hypothetical protein
VEISQLRDEMRAEFSAVRTEIRAGDEETRRSLRDEIRAGDDEIRRQMRDMGDEIKGQMLALHNELKTHMLALHENAIGRIALIREGLQSQPDVPRRPPRKRR